ncbi:MAG: Rid family hydrolase [Anaeromassilibacillus sp.]
MVFASDRFRLCPQPARSPRATSPQAEQVMKNVGEILKAANCGYEDVVKTTCFLAEMEISAHSMRCMRNTSPGNPHVPAWRSRRPKERPVRSRGHCRTESLMP